MDVTLVRNGYNLERRKMYVENPRHNLRSSVDFVWHESLENHPNNLKKQKEISAQLIKESYNKNIEKKLEDELKLNKSSFRVMMAAEKQPPQQSQTNSSYYDSLNQEIQNHSELKNSSVYKRSQSVAKSVFGYEIDRNAFQKESYLSKILSDRLEPFLNKNKSNQMETAGRHQSFAINHPVSLKY